MDHIGEWALPGVALVFLISIGVALVGVDEIVMGVLRRRTGTRADPTVDTQKDELLRPRGRAIRHASGLLRGVKVRRSSDRIADSASTAPAKKQEKDDEGDPRPRDRKRYR